MSDLDDVLDGWDALANGATEGPWTETATLHPDGGRHNHVTAAWDVERDICETPLTPGGSCDAAFIAAARTIVPQATAAIRAVLKAHLHRTSDDGRSDWCDECQDGPWPCRTVRTITDALTKEET